MVQSSYLKYFNTILKRRYFVIKFVVIVTILTVIISFIVTPKYTAVATILPPDTEQDAMIGMISSSIPGGISRFVGSRGLLTGMSSPSDLFGAIMQSSYIKGEILKRFNLKKVFRVRTVTDAGRMLDKMALIEISGEGIISVKVTYKNKQLAADIANAYFEELDKFNKANAMSVGKKYRIFIEQRLKESGDSLAKAEEALRNFQKTNRTIALDIEIEQLIKTIAELKSQVILREIQKGAASQYGIPNNPYIQGVDNELAELNRQLANIEFGDGSNTNKKLEFGAGYAIPLAKIPQLTLECARLLRDVKVQSAVFELLTQQYEQAKIMEVKDTPTVQYLDHAGPPEKRSYPNRRAMVMFSFVFSLFFGIFLTFFLEYLHHLRTLPEWKQFTDPLSDDIRKIGGIVKKILKK